MNDTIVTVVNRSKLPIKATADGQHYTFPPLSRTPMAQWKAVICRRQSAVMGTEDYYRPGAKAFLLSILELGHDITPLEQSDALDAFQTDTLPVEAQSRKKIGRAGPQGGTMPMAPLVDAAFTPNN